MNNENPKINLLVDVCLALVRAYGEQEGFEKFKELVLMIPKGALA